MSFPTAVPSSVSAVNWQGEPLRCLYCHCDHFSPLYTGIRDRLDYVPGEWDWLRCDHCGSVVLQPQPRPDQIIDLYPAMYSCSTKVDGLGLIRRICLKAEYSLFYRPQYIETSRRMERIIGENWKGSSLLDLGCGRGLRLIEFRNRGYQVAGIDPLADAIHHAVHLHRLEAVCDSFENARQRFPGRLFDIVTAFYLIEHLHDVDALLSTMFEMLRPGGWCVLGAPLLDSWQSRRFGRSWINATEAPRHLSLPTQRGIRLALKRFGAENIHFETDSLLNSAGAYASSALPGGTLTHAYGGASKLGRRLWGGLIALGALPISYFEERILKSYPCGLIMAQKPKSASPL
jgi:SAM-dependent methyltransferase